LRCCRRGVPARLKEAATAEFAERGLDGTTMTRIAARAGINKERLYSYYGDKNALWEVVLTDELDRLASAIALTGAGLDDIGDFAGATYDYHAANPALGRLLQWEGLTRGPAADVARCSAHDRDKADRFAQAQPDGVLDAGLDAANWCSLSSRSPRGGRPSRSSRR
jgi:AcrR family transcriptional regulator